MISRMSPSSLTQRPRLSVIIPSFNQGVFIRQTIESCLQQDYRPLEILVMDGASTDKTLDVLRSFDGIPELHWVSEKDAGVVDAVNKGLHRAAGDIAAIQSSDDYYLPKCFSAVVAVFMRRPEAGLVFGNAERVDAEGNHLFTVRQPRYSLARLLARQVTIYQPAAFFRRDLALRLGGWNPEIPHVPDTDLWFRLAFHAEVAQLDEILGAYRSHARQRDVQGERIYHQYLRMLELSSDLAEAPLHLKRAAMAGSAMLKFRYGGPWSNAELTHTAWTAVCHRPSMLFSRSFPKHRLIPGYFAMTRLRRILCTGRTG